jgi:hypothetical protein
LFRIREFPLVVVITVTAVDRADSGSTVRFRFSSVPEVNTPTLPIAVLSVEFAGHSNVA